MKSFCNVKLSVNFMYLKKTIRKGHRAVTNIEADKNNTKKIERRRGTACASICGAEQH